MRYINKLILINLVLFIYSCGTVKEGFKNQKKNNSDEFLVEKKSPLVMPPDYNDFPLPDTNNIETEINENKIQDLVSKKSESINQKKINQSFEQSLLDKIKN